jgi:hypothetical protein
VKVCDLEANSKISPAARNASPAGIKVNLGWFTPNEAVAKRITAMRIKIKATTFICYLLD